MILSPKSWKRKRSRRRPWYGKCHCATKERPIDWWRDDRHTARAMHWKVGRSSRRQRSGLCLQRLPFPSTLSCTVYSFSTLVIIRYPPNCSNSVSLLILTWHKQSSRDLQLNMLSTPVSWLQPVRQAYWPFNYFIIFCRVFNNDDIVQNSGVKQSAGGNGRQTWVAGTEVTWRVLSSCWWTGTGLIEVQVSWHDRPLSLQCWCSVILTVHCDKTVSVYVSSVSFVI